MKSSTFKKRLLAVAVAAVFAVNYGPLVAYADEVGEDQAANNQPEVVTEVEDSETPAQEAAVEENDAAEAAEQQQANNEEGMQAQAAEEDGDIKTMAAEPWTSTDATTHLPTKMDLSNIQSDANAHAFIKDSDTLYKYRDDETPFGYGDISYGYIKVEKSGNYDLCEKMQNGSYWNDGYIGIYNPDGTLMKSIRPAYTNRADGTNGNLCGSVHLEAGKVYGFAQCTEIDSFYQEECCSRDFRLELTKEDADPQDAVDKDEVSGLPKHIDMDDLSSLKKLGQLYQDSYNPNNTLYKGTTWYDRATANTFFRIIVPQESGNYNFTYDSGFAVGTYLGWYDLDGNLVETAVLENGSSKGLNMKLKANQTYVIAANNDNFTFTPGFKIVATEVGNAIEHTFEISCNVSGDVSATDEFYCTLDTGTKLTGTYDGVSFSNGKALIKLDPANAKTIKLSVILPDETESANYTITPEYAPGYTTTQTDLTGQWKNGETTKVTVEFTAAEKSSKKVVLSKIEDKTQLQEGMHYIFAQKGSDGKWYALACNGANTIPINVDEAKGTVSIGDKDIKNSPYVLKCSSVGTKTTNKGVTYDVYKFQTNVPVPGTTSKYSLKLDKTYVDANTYVGSSEGLFAKGGGDLQISLQNNKAYVYTSNKHYLSVDNGYFTYGIDGRAGDSGLVIFTDAETVVELDEAVTVNFHTDLGTVASSVETKSKFEIEKPADIEKDGTKYTFVGWSSDANVKTFLSLDESCDLYDTNENDNDKSSLKQAVKEKYSIIHDANPDIIEKIDIAKNEDVKKLVSADNTLDLYPVYAVRGFSQAVTSDDEDGTKIVGVSDWKMIQPDDTDYDKPDKEKWLGKIYVEVYKDGKMWGAPQPMYFRYHNDDAADLNLKFIEDGLLNGEYGGDLYKYLSDENAFPERSQKGGYVIDAVYADQGGSEDGLKYKYNWIQDNGGQLDNVKGGSTVKVYVTTVYQVEYFLNDVELSEEKNNVSQAGNEWHDSKFYTTPETERAFAKQVKDAKADYEIKMDNEYHQLMDGSEKTPGVCFVDENMKRGDYSGFAYYVHEYPHEITLPNLPTSKVAEGDSMTTDYWIMKDAQGNAFKINEKDLEYRPGEGYVVDVEDVDWLTEKTWMDNDEVERRDTHKDDLVNTYHLYVYTDNYSDPRGDEDPEDPADPEDPVDPEDPTNPDDPADPNGDEDFDNPDEDSDEDTPDDESSNTGDDTNIALYLALLLMSGGAATLVALRRKKSN